MKKETTKMYVMAVSGVTFRRNVHEKSGLNWLLVWAVAIYSDWPP